jgi:phosphonate C-P lyase system protein PhnG
LINADHFLWAIFLLTIGYNFYFFIKNDLPMDPNLFIDQINRIRELLPEMNSSEIEALSSALPMDKAEVVQAPQTGLIMAKVRDCFDTDFYLGEVLVTRAEVEYRGRPGRATIVGDHPSACLIAAVLESLDMVNDIQYLEAAHSICAPAAQRLASQQEQESQLVAATRVDFYSMAEES